MARACYGLSLDLEKGRLSTAVLEASGKHHDTQSLSLNGGQRPNLAVPANTEVVLGLPERAVRTRYVEMPPLKAEALETALRSKALRYFPLQAQQHSLSHTACPALADRKKKGYVLFVIDQDVTKKAVEWVGLKVDHVEFSSIGLVRWLQWEKPELRKGAYVWVDLGEDEVVVGLQVDRLFYGSRRLTPPICQLKGWRQQDLQDLGPYLDGLAHQVAGAVAYFAYRVSTAPVEIKRLVLTGLNAEDPTLNRALQTVVGLEPLVVKPDRLGLSPEYRAAAGFSLRNLES